MRNCRSATILLLVLFTSGIGVSQTMQLPAGFGVELLASDLNPVALTVDHHGRIWLAEKDGTVWIMEDGELLPDPFIELAVDDWNERGLAGIALHPNLDNSPYVYLYYTVPGANHNRLSRFTANGDVAVPGSEDILLDLDPLSGTIHNGGAMVFGNDGKLYVAVGDAAYAENASNLTNLLGKVLRLDDDGSIPVNNPFYNTLDGKERAIYAYGFRNPFSMGHDPVTDRIYIGDVGGALFEEVNELKAGKNYGWPTVEGYLGSGTAPPDYEDPIHAYSHEAGCAVVGAAFYRSDLLQFPAAYHGTFFFADYCMNEVRLLDPEEPTASTVFATGIERPLAFYPDATTGDLYFLGRAGIGGGSMADNTSTSEGTLWRIFYTGSGAPTISVQPTDALVSVGETAQFQIAAVGEAPLSYQWLENGQPLPGATTPLLTVDNVVLAADNTVYRCVVTNTAGSDTSDVALLQVTANQRPLPLIVTPTEGDLFRAGDVLTFQGQASDPEEGTLGVEALTWKIDWHHDQHTHPVLPPTPNVASGQWTVPVVNETDPNVWYRIYLTATDSEGLEQTVYTEIVPDLTEIVLNGTSGIPINVDGLIRTQPYSFESLIGIQRTLVAPPVYRLTDSLYIFQAWTNGSTESVQEFLTPEQGLQLGALYQALPLGDGTGLYAEYYDDPDLDLTGVPTLTRIDTTVAFLWDGGSPAPSLPNDYFTARWTGFVEPIFTEPHTFYINSDDGARLWIGDELLLDHWVPQAPTEHSATIELTGGERYPIRIEYMEIGGGAEITFSWSSPNMTKEVVPRQQLYPLEARGRIGGEVWLDANENDIKETIEPLLENVTVLLYWQADSTLVDVRQTDGTGSYSFDQLRYGAYYLHFLSQPTGQALRPGTGLSDDGVTEVVELVDDTPLELDVSFYPLPNRLRENEAFSLLRLSPNPTDGRGTLMVQPLTTSTYQWVWSDIHGRRLAEERIYLPADQITAVPFDLSHWPKGLYLMTLDNLETKLTLRVVKF